jgi:hypothetical protein
MTFYAGQKGPFFWFVFFGPAKKMNKMVNQKKNVKQKAKRLMKSNLKQDVISQFVITFCPLFPIFEQQYSKIQFTMKTTYFTNFSGFSKATGTDYCMLHYQNLPANCQVKVYDLTGRLIEQAALHGTNGEANLDTSTWPAGTYVLLLLHNDSPLQQQLWLKK